MLIGLKDNNYYSKVFKRINYKLQNSTFWVVITAQLRHELQDLRVGFAAWKEDLEVDYQKQVDDIFLYEYRCYIKKHGIIHDAPTFPSDDENEFLGDPSQKGGDVFEGGPFGE